MFTWSEGQGFYIGDELTWLSLTLGPGMIIEVLLPRDRCGRVLCGRQKLGMIRWGGVESFLRLVRSTGWKHSLVLRSGLHGCWSVRLACSQAENLLPRRVPKKLHDGGVHQAAQEVAGRDLSQNGGAAYTVGTTSKMWMGIPWNLGKKRRL